MSPERPLKNLYEILPGIVSVERELSQLDLATLQSIYEIAELVEQTLAAITKWSEELGKDEELTTVQITTVKNVEQDVVSLIERLLRKRSTCELLGKNPAIKRIFALSECDGNVRFVEARMKWFKGRIAQVIKRQHGLIRMTA